MKQATTLFLSTLLLSSIQAFAATQVSCTALCLGSCETMDGAGPTAKDAISDLESQCSTTAGKTDIRNVACDDNSNWPEFDATQDELLHYCP